MSKNRRSATTVLDGDRGGPRRAHRLELVLFRGMSLEVLIGLSPVLFESFDQSDAFARTGERLNVLPDERCKLVPWREATCRAFSTSLSSTERWIHAHSLRVHVSVQSPVSKSILASPWSVGPRFERAAHRTSARNC